ncbi:MAG TPA: NPCBM/NEW2 domain-containing protein, partial [Verrucomicrobiae bacterium]|nr:NPCBM/NEW2 domain-containing protein [Verrucomicrobiae bacterium]
EAQQAVLASEVLRVWHRNHPPGSSKKLHVVYYTPADRQAEPRYCQRLEAVMEDVRAFYQQGMERLGFGPQTFDLDRDAQGKWVLHFVQGKQLESAFTTWEGRAGTGSADAGARVRDECQPTLDAAGIFYTNETVLIFCNLANWNPKSLTFRHHSPYFGMWDQTSGLCFAADTAILDLENIPKKAPILDDQEYGKMSLGKFNTIFIGGIAHELGHAFSLPHCGERWDEAGLGTSIMGVGNHTYHDEQRGEGKGSFLTMASALKLASRPLFSKWDSDMALEPRLQTNWFCLSTNLTRLDLAGRKGALRVEGTVLGTPPVYAVIGYFDSFRDGGYIAPTATTVPDAQGHFALEISDLAPTENGQLRLQYCHANGAVSEVHTAFVVSRRGRVDLSQATLHNTLDRVGQAVVGGRLEEAEAALRELETSQASDLAREIARNLVATLKPDHRATPAEVPASVHRLPLGDARPETESVGWLKPSFNRLPPNAEIQSPFLDCGKIYATGLFAHSPSRYLFDLNGKWKSLRGEAGLDTQHQDCAAGVVFVIKTDGREVFRSKVVRQAARVSYDVDATGVKVLELIVLKATDSNACNWGLWLDPTLSR